MLFTLQTDLEFMLCGVRVYLFIRVIASASPDLSHGVIRSLREAFDHLLLSNQLLVFRI